jgi:ABC-2 type transport system permease protein
MLKGGDLRLVAVDILILSAMAIAAISFSWRRFKTRL